MIFVPTQDDDDDTPPLPPAAVAPGDGPVGEDAGDVSGDAGSVGLRDGDSDGHDSNQQHGSVAGSPLGALGGDSPKNHNDGSEAGVDSESESDALNAPTLRLGGSDSSNPATPMSIKGSSDDVDLESPINSPPNYDDSAEDQRDSQVSDGWMGKAHNYIAWKNREQDAQKHRSEWLKDLEFDLQQLDVMEEEMLPDYLAHAKKCYKIHGPSCYSTCASSEHFLRWIRIQKAQDCIFWL